MNLSRKNIFGRIYHFFYRSYPNDLCMLFWGTVWAILWLPTHLLGYYFTPAYERSVGETTARSCLLLLMLGVAFVFGSVPLVLYKAIFGIELDLWPWLLVSIGEEAITFLIIYLVFFKIKGGSLGDGVRNATENTIDTVAAIKGKYCTRITWR